MQGVFSFNVIWYIIFLLFESASSSSYDDQWSCSHHRRKKSVLLILVFIGVRLIMLHTVRFDDIRTTFGFAIGLFLALLLFLRGCQSSDQPLEFNTTRRGITA